MGRKKKEEEPKEYSPRELRLANLRNNKIDTVYLSDLVMDYKMKRTLDKEFPMPKELAEVVLIMIDKMLGSPSWRGYTPDWKEEFRGRAIEHVLRYGHNFSPEKCKNGKNDAFNYFAMIIVNAFVQSLKKCRIYSENNILMNHDVIYNDQQPYNGEEQEFKTDSDIKFIDPDINSLDYGSNL